eukprot:CAMPEP_0185771562 /NCGR_PEP_ID=MMETSP1174-20130828/64380_1 /TAXON_ID=35687 /ORGANISM="Dictyocha speculum, Strain CCMP1381" /LENGTH=50 /DNA_ID=CAMNT_0028457457 /DNA_START=873 /DNA_END=1025 /DNA_ORIENTATION=-
MFNLVPIHGDVAGVTCSLERDEKTTEDADCGASKLFENKPTAEASNSPKA